MGFSSSLNIDPHRHAGGLPLGRRIRQRRRHHDDDDGGNGDESEFDLPVHVDARQEHAEQTADDEPARPPRVQGIQLAGLLTGIESRDQRVDDRLDQAPADAGQHRAVPEDVVDARAAAERIGKDHQQRATAQEQAGEGQERAHPDDVEQRADQCDRQREAKERHAEDVRNHGRRMRLVDRIEVDALQVAGRVGAKGVGHARRHEREAADEKQLALPVGRVTIHCGALSDCGR
jgi:hypothetical protein